MAKPWYVDSMPYDVMEFPGCCGIGCVTGIYLDDSVRVDNFYAKCGFDQDKKFSGTPTQRAYSSEIKRMTTELKTKWHWPSYLVTITDEKGQDFDKKDKALRRNGWKQVNKSRSTHSNTYSIYTYCLNVPRRRKKKR